MDELNSRLEKLRSLTPREREVLGLVCQGGRSYAEIGEALFISERTVLFHMGNVYEKLGLAELSKADRQRELGRFSPLLGYLNEDEPQPAEPERYAQEPTEPRGLALIAVQEDAPVMQRQVSVEPWTGPPIEPGGAIIPKKRGIVGAVGPFLIVALLAGGLGIWGWNSLFPPVRHAIPPPSLAGIQPAAPAPAVATATVVAATNVVASVPTPTVPPTRTATSVPTATVIALTERGTVLRFGQAWRGDGLLLSTTGPVYAQRVSSEGGPWTDRCRINYNNAPGVRFVLQNQTVSTLNFQIPQAVFSLNLSTGKRYPGCTTGGFVAFNDMSPTKEGEFIVYFDTPWDVFQSDKRNPDVANYSVVVESLHARLPFAVWREPVEH